MRRRCESGVIVLTAVFFMMFTAVTMRYFIISYNREHMELAEARAELKIVSGESQGTIYDRNMMPLVNTEYRYYAAAVPQAADREELKRYAVDASSFSVSYDKGEPFVFECREGVKDSDAVTVFRIPVRTGKTQLAKHVIGSLSEGKGVSGIEYAYDSILRGDYRESSVTYQTDGFGRVLIGDGKEVYRSKADIPGVVTALDMDIQKICEDAGRNIEKGAIVMADVRTGDILAMASFPSYDTEDMAVALSDKRSPLINRALYSYGVGSIFKLVTACEAINEGNGGYLYKCKGSTDVSGKIFNCHRLDGHGWQDMTEAMRNSCNTYFITLSSRLDIDSLHDLAYSLGFGRETYLCRGIAGSAGVLPTADELDIPAELANFSFGQGKLTATPLQITQLTCAIAGDGYMPQLRLIKGLTKDGISVGNEKAPQVSRVMDDETAGKLRDMMISAIRDNLDSNARTLEVPIAAKTSTAQTGRYDKAGNELCHAWITGFFPAYAPEYALTVLIEDGGYGNDAAAPVFREIAETVQSEISD